MVPPRRRRHQACRGRRPQLQLLPVGVIFGVQNMHEPNPLITLLATVPEPPNVMLFHWVWMPPASIVLPSTRPLGSVMPLLTWLMPTRPGAMQVLLRKSIDCPSCV